MSNANELLIKISGDASNFKEAMESAEKQTETLKEGFADVAKVSAVALAALTAGVYVSVEAYGQKEAITNRLTASLQNQGIYNKALLSDYQAQADALEKLTGLDADLINKGQALGQAFLGQTKITNELTSAVADFAVANEMDVASAFEVVSKSIGTSNNMLQRYGIELNENASKQEKMAKVIEVLNQKWGGQAEAAGKGVESTKQVGRAFGDLAEAIGERLAPAIVTASAYITRFIDALSENKFMVDLIVSVGIAVGVVATLGVVAGTVGVAWLQLRAALIAAQVATSAMTIATRALVGATGLGLLIVALGLIYSNWSSIWPRMQAVFTAFTSNILDLLKGLGQTLIGAFTFNPQMIAEGLSKAGQALSKGFDDYNSIVDEKLKARQAIEDEAEGEKEKRNSANLAAAAKRAAEERAHAGRLAEIEREKGRLKILEAQEASKGMIELQRQEVALLEAIDQEKNAKVKEALRARLAIVRENQSEQLKLDQENDQLSLLQASNASKEMIDLQQQEIQLLGQIESEKNAEILAKLKERLERVRQLQVEQSALEKEQRAVLQQELLVQNEEFEALSDEQKAAFLEKNQQNLQAQVLTEKTAREVAAQERLQVQIKEHNQFLLNQQKFGTAYALINKVMNSEIYQGSKQAFGELAALQSSSNSTLKGIGKAAALASIAIKTAESAMNIYAGFSTIPIVGPALGVAGAAAAVAFGVEQAGKITAAADGGLLTGGIPGRDSIPVLAMPGELMVPTRNFDEVVNAVAAQRANGQTSAGGESVSGGIATIVLELKDQLVEFVEAKIVERQSLGISLLRTA